jgi:Putative zinc-finger
MHRDDLLSAYLDGELDAEQRAVVEAQLRSDQGAVTRLERMRSSDSLLRQAFPATAQVKDDRLAAMILAPKAPMRPRAWATRLAPLAAALVVGVLLGQWPRLAREDAAPFAVPLEHARLLDTMLSGESANTPNGALELVLSVQTEAGPCREYRLSNEAQSTAVLACRNAGEGWTMAAATSDPRTHGYTPAGAHAILDNALAERGQVEALDRSQERALIARGWR